MEGVDASLLIIGDGPEEATLKRNAQTTPHIHFIGFVQPDELPHWYAVADVFVFPSLGDANGVVVEEAMAAGLPVVSTENAGDIRSRIKEGVTGYVVPASNAEALAKQMGVLAADRHLRARLSASARVVAERYSISRYADDFDAFISGILSLPPRHNPCAFTARLLGMALLALPTRGRDTVCE